MEKVLEAYKVFLETEELGATDTKKLNLVISKLDNENKILKNDVIFLIAKSSKDKDGAYRNFVSRLENAINVAKDEAKEDIKDVLNTLYLEKIKINDKQYLKFHGNVLKPLNTVIPNTNYSEENYIEALGTNSKLNIFISYATSDEKDVALFKSTLEKIADDKVITWTMGKLVHGISFDKQIKKELEKCDYGFAMVSKNFLNSDYIKEVELKRLLEDNIIFPILLDGSFSELGEEHKDEIVKKLLQTHIFSLKDRGRNDSFSKMVDDNSREIFVNAVIKALENRKNHDLEEENIFRANHQCYINSRKEYNPKLYTDSYCTRQEITTAVETMVNDEETLENRVNLLADMINWVTEKNSPIYALLGEYGVGKTFNTRMFASKLEELRKTKKDLPYPLYIDLRDTPTFIELNGSKRQVTVEELIVEILRLSNNKEFSAEKIIEDNKKGKAILIFDGLDEKLVHYPKDMKNKFLRELVNVLDVRNFVKTNQKILISCRTHYFESIKEQNSFLRDNERFDVGKTNYHATEILPFNMEQIKSYIKKVFPSDEIEKILTFISSDNYLKTIVTKPLMLNKLSAILPKLIEHKNGNKKITSKVFYQALIDDTFSRDNEKHTINIRDKKRLLKEVSYMFYKKGIQSISIDKLNDWFNEYIYEQPIFKKYQEKDFDILELDLRNSSLLVRFGDANFGFSHSSFYEYFIAEYLFENWENFHFSGKLSELTFEFIKDTIKELDFNDKNEFIGKLKKTLAKDTLENKKFQLDLLKELKIDVDNIILDTQELEYYTMKNIHCNYLKVRNTNLFSCKLIDCSINSLDVVNSNFNESYIKNCKITKITKDNKSIMDYITDFDNVIDEHILKLKGLHNFKNNNKINITRVNISGGRISSIAEDEKNIYVGSSDGFKVYSKESFSCIKEINSGWVNSIAEDEKNIYVGSRDGFKVYSKESFSCIKEINSGWVNSIAEDEKNTYVGFSDGFKVYSKESFSCIKEINGGWVNSIAEDEKNIYVGSSDGFKVYSKKSFSCIKEINSGRINSIAEDEKNIYVGSRDGFKVYSKESFSCIKEINSGWVDSIAEDEKNIYVGSDDGFKVYSKESFSCIKEINSGRINSIAEDEKNIYVVFNNGFKVYSKESFSCIKEINSDWVNSIAEDEKNIYVGSRDGFKVYSKESFSCIKEINSGWVNSIAEDEKNTYVGFSDGFKVYSKESFSCIKEINGGWVNSIAEDEKNIYVGFSDGFKVYSKESFSCIKEINGGWVNSIAEDEKNTYVGSSDGFKVYSKKSFSCIKEINSGRINSIAEDEKNIYVGSDDGFKVYSKESFSCIKEINSGWVDSIAEDEKNIYVGSDDGFKVYSKESFSCIKEINSDRINSIAEDEKNIYVVFNNGFKVYNKINFNNKIILALGNERDWCSINFERNVIKGTEMSWKLVTVEDEKGYVFSVDELVNFELCNYINN